MPASSNQPASKLATAKALSLTTAASSLAPVLGLGEVDADELYAALDWLLERQPGIEAALANRHLADGTLVLYDVSSSWLEGRCCELARFGHSRDSKPNKLQIVYGLLCAADGCLVAIEVFKPAPAADSDEVAWAIRDDVARHYEMMSPGFGASLAWAFLALAEWRSSVPMGAQKAGARRAKRTPCATAGGLSR